MATYRIKAPDGSQWDVNAPDGATQDAVLRYAQAQWKAKPKKTIADWKPADPTEGMGPLDKAMAGAGKAFVDVGRGVGQMVGIVPQSEVDEAKRLDAPLMDTGAGIGGNIGANMLTALIPGGNTVKGAALVGAGLSALQPTATGESRLQNTATGGALGALAAGAARLIGKGKDAATDSRGGPCG